MLCVCVCVCVCVCRRVCVCLFVHPHTTAGFMHQKLRECAMIFSVSLLPRLLECHLSPWEHADSGVPPHSHTGMHTCTQPAYRKLLNPCNSCCRKSNPAWYTHTHKHTAALTHCLQHTQR